MAFSTYSLVKLLYPLKASRVLVHSFGSKALSKAISDSDTPCSDSDPHSEEPPFKNPLLVEGPVGPYNIKEDDEATWARFDIPGVEKEGVKVWVEKNALMFNGVEPSDSEAKRRYSGGIRFNGGPFVLDQIKAEVNNGVLKVVIPKVKQEDRSESSDVLLIKVN